MTPPTKRSVLLVILAFIIPWMIVSLCDFIVAERGGVYMATRSWYLKGPGGRYGALESEATRSTGQHVAWETEFFCGPLRYSLPFSAPVSLVVLAMWSAAPISVALLLRFGTYAHRHTQAAKTAERTGAPPLSSNP
jgi:hypothetical protein